MIELSAASTWASNGHPILAPTTETFFEGERVGILAAPGSGKTTLARLLAGLDPPKSGRISRDGPASTILGQENLLHPEMSVLGAIRNMIDLFDLDPNRTLPRTLMFCDLKMGAKIKELSPVTKSVLAFALSIQIPGHWLVADDRLIPNDARFATTATAAIERRLRNAGLIFISKNATQIGRYCDRFFVLHKAQLIEMANFRDAGHLFQQSLEVS